jgi:hypothetical protein
MLSRADVAADRVSFVSRAAAPAAALGLAAAAVGLIAEVDPNQPGHYPTCPFLALTGAWCPGCGSLRAVHALAHGDLGTALDRNPLAVLAVPLVATLWLSWARRRVLGLPRTWAAPAWAINALLVGVLAFWVLRNLGPFSWLAP